MFLNDRTFDKFNSRQRNGFQQMAQQQPVARRLRGFKIDPTDYRPTRVGVRCERKVIVIEYRLKSTEQKRYLHNIKVYKYQDPMAFGISVSRSGSFKEALSNEIIRTVDQIYGEHCEYLPPEKIERALIEDLVRQIMSYTQQTKRIEVNSEWNQVHRNSFSQKAGGFGINQSPNTTSKRGQQKNTRLKQELSQNSQEMKNSKENFFGKRDIRSASPERFEIQQETRQGKHQQRVNSQMTNERNHRQSVSTNINTQSQANNNRMANNSNLSSRLSHSQSLHDDEATISKSLTDLADLPTLGNPIQQSKKAPLVWNDEGFDDWNLDDANDNQPQTAKEEPTQPSKDKWAPPSPSLKNFTAKPLNKLESVKTKIPTAQAEDDWGMDDWGDSVKPLPLDTRKIDYSKLDLNKLSDTELARHKAEMDKDYQKKIIRPGDKDFVYDKRVDFSKAQKVDASWDEDEGDDYSEDF